MSDTGVGIDVLAESWRTFRRHRPAGAYLVVGQLDGDCHECGEAWPCSTVRPVLDAYCAARTREAVDQVLGKVERRIDEEASYAGQALLIVREARRAAWGQS